MNSLHSELSSWTVRVIEPERMNLLGLMLASVIERRLTDSAARRHLHSMRGDVLVEASAMRVVLRFGGERVEVRRELDGRAVARVRGTLTALLDAAFGRRRLWSVLTGRLWAWGGPFTLWHVLSLLRV